MVTEARKEGGVSTQERTSIKEQLLRTGSTSLLFREDDDFEVLEEIYKPDSVCGVKSWLNDTINTSKIFPNIFSVFRNDRTTETTGGGV